MATQTLITEAQFDALPEEVRDQHELLDGELIELASPAAEHQWLALKLSVSLYTHIRPAKLGGLLGDVEFLFGGSSRFRPDLAVLLGTKWERRERWKVPIRTVPDIAVEIVSPSESAFNVRRKNKLYLESGVAEVWTMYPAVFEIDVDTSRSHSRLALADSLSSGLLPGWSLSLQELFAE